MSDSMAVFFFLPIIGFFFILRRKRKEAAEEEWKHQAADGNVQNKWHRKNRAAQMDKGKSAVEQRGYI